MHVLFKFCPSGSYTFIRSHEITRHSFKQHRREASSRLDHLRHVGAIRKGNSFTAMHRSMDLILAMHAA